MSSDDGVRPDFFVSYTKVDRGWAEWIAWELEDAGYKVLLQAWDMVPGTNWLAMMDQAIQSAERTIAVLSAAYLNESTFGKAEWLGAFRQDPSGLVSRIIPVRIEDCTVSGLLAGIVYADLVGLSEDEARDALLEAVRSAVTRRRKPLVPPRFPGRVTLEASAGAGHVRSAPPRPSDGGFPGDDSPSAGLTERGAAQPSFVTPLVRRHAVELGVDLSQVAGTGVGGRIRDQDVVRAARTGVDVTMPPLGTGVTEATVTRWLKREGQPVTVDESLAEISTDKVDTEISSPATGVLVRILVGEDETADVGSTIAVIGPERR